MKLPKLPIALLAIMIAMAAANPGWAHGGGHGGGGHGGGYHGGGGYYHGGGHSHSHVGVGVFLGGPLWWPWYYPGPSYYYPPAVAVPESPPPAAYIEQGGDAPYSQSYWYYCNSSRTYYPYVQQCPEGWQQVMPRPPS